MGNLQIKKQATTSHGRFPWWILYVLFVLILSALYLSDGFSSPRIIKASRFETELISRNAVEKIIVVDQSIAEIYIKPEFANDPSFSDIFKGAVGQKENKGPHYWFSISSMDSFQKRLDELQKDKSPSSKIPVEYRKGIGGWRNIIQ